jgi:hypothetical protein
MHCTTDLETQAVASLLAFAFNDAVGRASPFKVKFLGAKAVVFPAEARGKTRSDGDRLEVRGQLPVRWMSMEKRFRGEVEMERYTNNGMYVRRVSEEDARGWQTRSPLLWPSRTYLCRVAGVLDGDGPARSGAAGCALR